MTVKGIRGRSAAAAVVVAIVLCGLQTRTAIAQDVQQLKRTQDGYTLRVVQKNTTIIGVPPLDSSPFSREAFLSSDNSALIEGPAGSVIRGAVMETGYQIGFPVGIAQDGINITLRSPDLSVTGGLNAGVSTTGVSAGSEAILPGATNGTGSLGLQASIVPSQTASFRIEHGKITVVPLARIEMTRPRAYVNFGNVHLFANGAGGQLTVRTYTKLAVRTIEGLSTVVAYGESVRL